MQGTCAWRLVGSWERLTGDTLSTALGHCCALQRLHITALSRCMQASDRQPRKHHSCTLPMSQGFYAPCILAACMQEKSILIKKLARAVTPCMARAALASGIEAICLAQGECLAARDLPDEEPAAPGAACAQHLGAPATSAGAAVQP